MWIHQEIFWPNSGDFPLPYLKEHPYVPTKPTVCSHKLLLLRYLRKICIHQRDLNATASYGELAAASFAPPCTINPTPYTLNL